jgi:hypothetical protein
MMKLPLAACQEVSVISFFLFDREVCDNYYQNTLEEARFKMMLWMSNTIELKQYRRKLLEELREMLESQSQVSSQGDSWSMPEDIGGD